MYWGVSISDVALVTKDSNILHTLNSSLAIPGVHGFGILTKLVGVYKVR